MSTFRFTTTAYFAIMFSLMGCQDLGDPYIPARVTPGVSIEGVRLGETQALVEGRLGVAPFGYCDGYYKSWFVGWYDSGAHAGLRVCYIDNSSLGQQTNIGLVDQLYVEGAYAGKTPEGIGIGCSITQVRAAYGIPRSTWNSADYYDRQDEYCFGGRWFSFLYIDGFVARMSMGVFYRTPLDTLCK